jgi:hypothetical protein
LEDLKETPTNSSKELKGTPSSRESKIGKVQTDKRK